MNHPIAVIVHQKRHFDQWVNWVADGDQNKFVFVSDPRHLEGRFFSEVMAIGPYWHHPKYDYLRDLALTRIRAQKESC